MENNERVKVISDEYFPIKEITEDMKEKNNTKKTKSNRKKENITNEENKKKEFSLRGIKDKDKQRTLLENEISKLEKEIEQLKTKLEKINKELLIKDVNKLKERYSQEEIIKALEQV